MPNFRLYGYAGDMREPRADGFHIFPKDGTQLRAAAAARIVETASSQILENLDHSVQKTFGTADARLNKAENAAKGRCRDDILSGN